jgi:hypothetical protein
MCQNETCSMLQIFKHLSDTFHIQKGLKKIDALSLLSYAYEYAISIVHAN